MISDSGLLFLANLYVSVVALCLLIAY